MSLNDVFTVLYTEKIHVESGYHSIDISFPDESLDNLLNETVTKVEIIENNVYIRIEPSNTVFEEWIRVTNAMYNDNIDKIMNVWKEFKYATQDPS